MKILKYCVIYNMLNLITFLQTISDSDYGYNFLVLKFWNSDMHFASQWYYYYHLTHIKPGMFLSKNYFCKKKKWGRRAVFNAWAGPEKAMMAYSLTRYRTEKMQEGKTRKMGDRGIARIFFKGVEGGSHCFKQRVLTIFLLPEYCRLFV